MRKYYKFESQAQSDSEIYDELSPEQIKKIEDEAKKIFNKKDVDLEKIMKSDKKSGKDKEEGEDEKDEQDGESANESVVMAALGSIAVAGLVSLILSALGSVTNLISKKTGMMLDKKQWEQYKFVQKVIKAYKKLCKSGVTELEIDGKKMQFTWKNWTEIGEKSTEKLRRLGFDYHKSGQVLAWDSLKQNYKDGADHSQDDESDSEEMKKKKQGYAASRDIASKLKVTKNESLRYLKRYDEFILEGHAHTDFTKFKGYEVTKSDKDKDFIMNGVIPYVNEKIESILPVKTKLGNALGDAGHAIHEALIVPIRTCIRTTAWITGWKWAYNPETKETKEKSFENRDALAKVIYAGIMIWYGGVQAVDKLGHLHGVKEYAGLIKETWKGSENIKEFVTNIVELLPKKMGG